MLRWVGKMNNIRACADAVSYTHLDVYKRQMIKWVQGMNNLRNRVQEIVKAEVIFA